MNNERLRTMPAAALALDSHFATHWNTERQWIGNEDDARAKAMTNQGTRRRAIRGGVFSGQHDLAFSSSTNHMPTLNDMSKWAVRTRGGLREFFTKEGTHWVEQNRAKNSRWAKLAREGHDVGERGGYTGRILIDGEVMTAKEAYQRFFR